MPTYSHSKLSTFEQCRLKYKFKYIDKIIPEIEKTIESLLGFAVHEVLEYLYNEVKSGRIPSIDEIITIYTDIWKENYKEEIVIVKKDLTAKDYFNKGVEFLINYYMKHKPFDDNTLEVEKKITINLDEKGKYKIIGFIDRLSYNSETEEYEIHDYKTANNLPLKEKIETDRQLALYAIAIKELFGKDKKVCLTWHYLAHDKKICSRRTNEQLEQLKKDVLELINKVESTYDFPANKSVLCSWCEYKPICPAWSEQFKNNNSNYSGFSREKQKQIDM